MFKGQCLALFVLSIVVSLCLIVLFGKQLVFLLMNFNHNGQTIHPSAVPYVNTANLLRLMVEGYSSVLLVLLLLMILFIVLLSLLTVIIVILLVAASLLLFFILLDITGVRMRLLRII